MNKNRPIKEVVFGTDVPVAFSLEGVSDDVSLNSCFVRAKAYIGSPDGSPSNASMTFNPEGITQVSEQELLLPVQTGKLDRGLLWVEVEVHLPDQNFGSNYRTEILRGFTYIKVV